MIELSHDPHPPQTPPLVPLRIDEGSSVPVSAVNSMSFRALVSAKIRVVAPLLGLSLFFILGTALLAGYNRPRMAQKVVGAFNVGYLLVLLMYGLSWAAACIYVYAANNRFDTQAALAADDARRRSRT
ncbi:DUF485 domain-containing protein [Paraburkholderia sp. CI3]|uniref:DUF485 domain-containing protein n=1 Tax=Paraburkholderia sp. CI3 TaxID=2991060 RepID=UPI003D1DBC00